ncbi:coatomer subunit epsilon NDAI_0A02350 [Naumovozyma dairenensis CBS 421]|uniref:Coatomer subunit epsilon n=1 Tax=Naumovozyma dairenensis (strain ATCC 10597 / BCRC 20456 / CBS 421 / NBRC 0211 / NRRL Y-12639) TaxID=1071378 RepID=G0W3K5_NAUDC|nr:hypothetical protein NDAI_0A02350 [Naumovozyma dairenensis CBS 421]CCD22393.1 hypothetical protein NDAI_0A02350 [Naumovozyma dairenensis CBS 421]
MDYFTIKQSYYAGDYPQVLKEIEGIENPENDDTLSFYKLKSQLVLNKYTEDESSLLGATFALYSDFLTSRDIKKLENSVSVETSGLYELNLLACAQAILGDYEESLATCFKGIERDDSIGNVELILLAVQVALLNDQPSMASSALENYVSANQDAITSDVELIINLAEAYIKFYTTKDVASSNFYYFEELAQTFPTWKTQLGLLNSHLQQRNIEEAEDIVRLLESDFYCAQADICASYKEHLLANKITLSIMQGKDNTNELRAELAKVNPKHTFVKSNDALNAKFNDLVIKYSSN